MTVVLSYIKVDGSQEQVEFDDDVTEISIRGQEIHEINLTPLSSCNTLQDIDLAWNKIPFIALKPLGTCTRLQNLSLSNNQLKAIDLGPLSHCKNLRELFLGWNSLPSVNLEPLSGCTSLQLLNLSRNNLENINLEPLESCEVLEEIALASNRLDRISLDPLSSCITLQRVRLSENHLQTIDLTPLSLCKDLEYLGLDSNHLQTIDLTPLIFNKSLDDLEIFLEQRQKTKIAYSWLNWHSKTHLDVRYERPPQTHSWRFLHQVALSKGHDKRVQQDILYALGLGDYGFIDHDLRQLFISIPPHMPLPTVREHIRPTLVMLIAEAIDEGRATAGFSMEKHLSPHAKIASMTQDIVELRTSEIQKVRLGVSKDGVDLRDLYLTAYGYEILSTLGLKLRISIDELSKVSEAFSKLGIDLKIGTATIPVVRMSNALKQAIWWIVENRGRPWSEIKQYPDFGDEFDCI